MKLKGVYKNITSVIILHAIQYQYKGDPRGVRSMQPDGVLTGGREKKLR